MLYNGSFPWSLKYSVLCFMKHYYGSWLLCFDFAKVSLGKYKTFYKSTFTVEFKEEYESGTSSGSALWLLTVQMREKRGKNAYRTLYRNTLGVHISLRNPTCLPACWQHKRTARYSHWVTADGSKHQNLSIISFGNLIVQLIS